MDPARRRRKQRHRAQLMSGFAVITLGALLTIAYLVVRMAKLPTTASLSAATSSSPHAMLADKTTGLAFELLASPWRDGCPMRDYPANWTSGEGAVAGHPAITKGGHDLTWYANACIALLPTRFQHGNLAQETASAADAIDTDQALTHHRTVTSSTALEVSGHNAWVVKFTVSFTSRGLPWSSEAGAVMVVDRGGDQTPALFYVSVPSNLGGTATVSTVINSVR